MAPLDSAVRRKDAANIIAAHHVFPQCSGSSSSGSGDLCAEQIYVAAWDFWESGQSTRGLNGAAYRNECMAATEYVLSQSDVLGMSKFGVGTPPFAGPYGYNGLRYWVKNALLSGQWIQVTAAEAIPGDLVVLQSTTRKLATTKIGTHIGVVMTDGCTNDACYMISNSSHDGKFDNYLTVANQGTNSAHSDGDTAIPAVYLHFDCVL